jgi:hypothetical protein
MVSVKFGIHFDLILILTQRIMTLCRIVLPKIQYYQIRLCTSAEKVRRLPFVTQI